MMRALFVAVCCAPLLLGAPLPASADHHESGEAANPCQPTNPCNPCDPGKGEEAANPCVAGEAVNPCNPCNPCGAGDSEAEEAPE